MYAEWRLKLEQQLRDDMWSGHTSETTSGPTEQEADKSELNRTRKIKNVQYSQNTEA